ncbi:MAG: DNA polymerase I [Lachnospiraceae bacterium]|nr:DNA polymerase I [Lachnospiraceae bacterium]
MADKIVLIDGNSIVNRAFYGLPDLTASDGTHTNGVLGFLNILFRILEEEKPNYLAVAFDVKHPTFRHEKYAEYKGTRKPMPEELREQVPLLKQVLSSMGVLYLERPGYEADDILGTIAVKAEREGFAVSLVSGDRDLLQMADDVIKVRIPKTKKGGTEIEDYHTQDVMDKYGVRPRQIIDLKGLMGDASDNIPGVPGIGEKTAVKILSAFGSVENAYAHVEEITPNKAKENLKEHYALAVLSKELATIKTDCELEFRFEDAKLQNLFTEEAYLWFKKLEFKSLLARFQENMETHKEAVEDSFVCVEDLTEADAVFDRLYAFGKSGNGQVSGTRAGAGGQKEGVRSAGFCFLAQEGECFGLSLAFGKKDIYWIRCGYMITEGYLQDKLTEYLKGGGHVVCVDLKAQLPFVYEVDQETDWTKENTGYFGQFTDVSVAGYLMNPLKDSYLAEDIARDYLEMAVPSAQDLFGKKKLSLAAQENEKEFITYACYQSAVPYLACDSLRGQLAEAGMEELFLTVEMPLVFTLYEMEQRGIRANREALSEYGSELAVNIDRIEKEIYRIVGEEFNINSPKQLGVILFEKLKLPFGKKTKTGYSTSADVLEKLRSEDPVVDLILQYRQLTKLKSNYSDGLVEYICDDGRIHGKFNQTVTATGRISSTDPNLQNIPIRMELGRRIRKVFTPKDGYVFLDADYSQIELRVLAHMSGDERLIEAYHQAEDIHRITASQVFHTPLAEVTPAQRSNAKAVNFGIIYGISSFGLGQNLNITRKEAESYIKQYLETYPQVKEFLNGLVEYGKKEGCAVTMFGRRRPVPELSSGNFMQRSFGERVAMNSPIQGTAADIIKIAMVRVNERLKAEGMKARLILQVHDELLVEAPMEEKERAAEILREEMRGAADLKVALEVEVGEGTNWYNAH